MRKGRDGEKKRKKEKTDDYRAHNVITSSRPPERWPLERHTLVPIFWHKKHSEIYETFFLPIKFQFWLNFFKSDVPD